MLMFFDSISCKEIGELARFPVTRVEADARAREQLRFHRRVKGELPAVRRRGEPVQHGWELTRLQPV